MGSGTKPLLNGRHPQPNQSQWKTPAAAHPLRFHAPIFPPPHPHAHQPHQQQPLRPLPPSPPPPKNFSEMAASQVEALKKAYAAVMLNMAQESAARVLAAERRAAALAAGLAAAKEDGVAALVRLKAVMEARIKEVELQSLQHVKKIKELEEQLQSLQHVKIKELEEQLYGAQNSVTTLQSELQIANTELENTRRTLAEKRINCVPTSKKMDSDKNTSSHSKMNSQSGSMSLKNKKAIEDTCLFPVIAEENEAGQNMRNIYRRSPDLPSFMERNKKHKLYHNGCTQRIHALKQQNADARQEKNRKHATGRNSRSKGRKNDAAKNPCYTRSIMEQLLETKFLGNCKRKRGSRSRPCYYHDSSGEIREAEYKLSDASDGNGCLLLLQALQQDLSPLEVSAGHGGEALTDLKDDSLMNRGDAGLNHCPASRELIDIIAAKDVMVQKRKRTKTVRVLEADFSDSKSVSESGNTMLRSTSEKSLSDTELISERKQSDSNIPPGNNVPVFEHSTKNVMHQADANNNQLETENSSAVLLQSSKSEVMDYGNLLVEQPEYKTPDNDTAPSFKEIHGEGSYSLASNKADASTVISLDKEENLKVASSGLPRQAPEKPDASVGSSLYASSRASMQAEGVRHIKHTFSRRKRKCVSMDSTPPCAVQDKSSDLHNAPKEGAPHPNAKAQVNLIDSTQDDNQLVQVAQQLILLSERD